MAGVTIATIEERLHELSPQELSTVYDFVSYLAERRQPSALDTMLGSEEVLARDWNRPEEDAAWADL